MKNKSFKDYLKLNEFMYLMFSLLMSLAIFTHWQKNMSYTNNIIILSITLILSIMLLRVLIKLMIFTLKDIKESIELIIKIIRQVNIDYIKPILKKMKGE